MEGMKEEEQPSFYIQRGRRDSPATGTSVQPISDDHFPFQKPRPSVILMTLISVLFSNFFFNFNKINSKILFSHVETWSLDHSLVFSPVVLSLFSCPPQDEFSFSLIHVANPPPPRYPVVYPGFLPLSLFRRMIVYAPLCCLLPFFFCSRRFDQRELIRKKTICPHPPLTATGSNASVSLERLADREHETDRFFP